MQTKLRIGLVQMSMSQAKKANLNKAIKKIKEAAKKGAEIVCLPELFTTKYFPQTEDDKNFELAEEIPNKTTEALSKAAKDNNIILIGGSIFEKELKQKNSPKFAKDSSVKLHSGANFFDKNCYNYYNTAIVFNNDGKLIGKYRKVHIPNDPCFYEKTYFTAGNEYAIFATKVAKIGMLICYDQWFPEAARINALKGAQIIFYPTAIGWANDMKQTEPFSIGRWIDAQRSHASMNNVFVAAVNRVGTEGKLDFWGNSFVAEPYGNIVARAGDKEEVLVAEIDLGLIEKAKGWGFLENRRPETYKELVK